MTKIAETSSAARPAPLSPQVMAQAGVSLSDALWYARIPVGHKKVQALNTPTGTRILNSVRQYLGGVQSNAMPATA